MKEPLNDRYWLVARDKPGLLMAMMQELAGGAHISFEGDLRRCAFPAELRPSPEETDALRRHTCVPRQDFVVLPLEAQSIRPILDVILPDNRCLNEIIHIQIEKNGELQFGSYDNFHEECIVCLHGVSTELLDRLQASNVIRSWSRPSIGAGRWHG